MNVQAQDPQKIFKVINGSKILIGINQKKDN